MGGSGSAGTNLHDGNDSKFVISKILFAKSSAWSKAQVDKMFLAGIIKICNISLPETVKIAINNCKNNGVLGP
jgi:hypothetical protein